MASRSLKKKDEKKEEEKKKVDAAAMRRASETASVSNAKQGQAPQDRRGSTTSTANTVSYRPKDARDGMNPFLAAYRRESITESEMKLTSGMGGDM